VTSFPRRTCFVWLILATSSCSSFGQKSSVAVDENSVWNVVLSDIPEGLERLLLITPSIARSAMGNAIDFAEGVPLLAEREELLPHDERIRSEKLDILLKGMVTKSKVPTAVGRLALTSQTTRLASDHELKAARIKCGDCDWETLKNWFDGATGTVRVSRVGFLDTLAMVYAEKFCGELCGQGTLYLLENLNHRWRVRQKVTLWRS